MSGKCQQLVEKDVCGATDVPKNSDKEVMQTIGHFLIQIEDEEVSFQLISTSTKGVYHAELDN